MSRHRRGVAPGCCRSAVALALLACHFGGTGCAAPGRLVLESPLAGSGGIFRDAYLEVRLAGTTERLEATIANLSGGMVYLHWERAVLVDPLGGQHAVAAFRGEPSTELLDGAGQPLGLGPGQTWHGTVHARDRLGRRSRGQLLLRPLLSGEQARPGGKLRLVLPVDIGVRPAVYEFTLAVHEPAP